MAHDGTIFVATIGAGTIQKLYPDGRVEELLTEVDDVKLTSANYVFLDSKNRLWMVFSTCESRWWPAAAQPRADGYTALLDEKGPRIARVDIYFTNEIRLDTNEKYLYVAETMMSRIIRSHVQCDGSLPTKKWLDPMVLAYCRWLRSCLIVREHLGNNSSP